MSAKFDLVKELRRRRTGTRATQAFPVKIYRDGVLDVDATRKAYSDYMSDPGWRARRGRLVKDECLACGETEDLHLHHVTYEHVGRERPWELVTLCASCHASVHWQARKNPSQSLRTATMQYVRAYQKRRMR